MKEKTESGAGFAKPAGVLSSQDLLQRIRQGGASSGAGDTRTTFADGTAVKVAGDSRSVEQMLAAVLFLIIILIIIILTCCRYWNS